MKKSIQQILEFQIGDAQGFLIIVLVSLVMLVILASLARRIREKRVRTSGQEGYRGHIEEALAHPVWQNAATDSHSFIADNITDNKSNKRADKIAQKIVKYDGFLYLDHARHLHPPRMDENYTIPPEHFQYLFRVGAGHLQMKNQDTLELTTETARFQYRFSELGKIFFHQSALVLIPIFDNRLTLLFLSAHTSSIRKALYFEKG